MVNGRTGHTPLRGLSQDTRLPDATLLGAVRHRAANGGRWPYRDGCKRLHHVKAIPASVEDRREVSACGLIVETATHQRHDDHNAQTLL
jgi:hypothetical protein